MPLMTVCTNRINVSIRACETTVSAVLFANLGFGKVVFRKRREALQALELHSEYNACFLLRKRR